MRHLAQARNPYSRSWLWIPGSRKSAPRNDDQEVFQTTVAQRIPNRAVEHLQSRFEIALEMHAQGAPAALGQNVEIAAGLRRLDNAEARLLAGYREIVGIVRCDLQEHAAVGAAFIGLSGGMQERRAEFGAGRKVVAVAHRKPHVLQFLDMR